MVPPLDNLPTTVEECNKHYEKVVCTNNMDKIDPRNLSPIPGIVARIPPHMLHPDGGLVPFFPQALYDQASREAKLEPMDLTSKRQDSSRVVQVGSELIVDYAREHTYNTLISKEYGVAPGPTMGIRASNRESSNHSHAQGVLFFNLETDLGVKEFELAYQHVSPGKGDKVTITNTRIQGKFKLKGGEVLWIPPHMLHKVFTNGGQRLKIATSGATEHHPIACVYHWITWCTPHHMRDWAVAMVGAGLCMEEQKRTGLVNNTKKDVAKYMLCNEKERMRRGRIPPVARERHVPLAQATWHKGSYQRMLNGSSSSSSS